MSYRIEWSRGALADLQAVRADIAPDSPRAARPVANQLQTMVDGLAVTPQSGRPVADASQAREVVTGRYVLRYRVRGEMVLIVRLTRSAQED